MLGLCCFIGFSLDVAHGLLIGMTSLVAEQTLGQAGISGCGSQALEHRLGGSGAQA